LVDDGSDPGCAKAESLLENPRCDDGLDNDGDGDADDADSQCTSRSLNVEAESRSTVAMLIEEPLCGLGAELVLIFPPLIWLRGRRRRAGRG
ncbi:MAG: hypothetical protein JRG92_23490, partial [Deltaproteobacteria bacterium]|nr:hypothetical protein [Deltaproteobacteria bacterium]MBW2386604.1 hypothetical protein [Deltaproteobacteria bacterium]